MIACCGEECFPLGKLEEAGWRLCHWKGLIGLWLFYSMRSHYQNPSTYTLASVTPGYNKHLLTSGQICGTGFYKTQEETEGWEVECGWAQEKWHPCFPSILLSHAISWFHGLELSSVYLSHSLTGIFMGPNRFLPHPLSSLSTSGNMRSSYHFM